MTNYREKWTAAVLESLKAVAAETGAEAGALGSVDLIAETPPSPELGDLAFPLFGFAKVLKKSPAAIATAVADRLSASSEGEALAAGPYVNVKLPRASYVADVLTRALQQGTAYGDNDAFAGVRVTIEYSSPNTNKPLHLGHLRNDALGECVARSLAACGAFVRKVNLINDRGIHICKSMLAYQRFGNGEIPESTGRKGDHFVGEYYVRFDEWAATDPSAEELAHEMLRKWEAGDEETLSLWKRMNEWVISGVRETYEATNVHFDKYYHESDTYKLGRDQVEKGLESGVFYREEDGSVWIDLSSVQLDKKILLRKDGTSVYLTQDIGTVIARYEDSPFDRLIYVVASEQDYHFRVLFHVLEQLGFAWAPNLHHLSYGMVNLPDGRMKSREGTIVDADDLLDQLRSMARDEIREKGREDEVGDLEATAHSVALGAVHYYVLQVTPTKDMIFNPEESLSFTGNTGPYLQYTGARISSMIRKAAAAGIALDGELTDADWLQLRTDEEWALVKMIGAFPGAVELAARGYNPTALTSFLYDLAKTYSGYYHDHPILNAEDESVRVVRLALSNAVRLVLQKGMNLLNIPFLDKM